MGFIWKLIHKPKSFFIHAVYPGLPVGMIGVFDWATALYIAAYFALYEVAEEIRMYIDAKSKGKTSTDRTYEDIQGIPVGIIVGWSAVSVVLWLVFKEGPLS